jgi:hypothetical protein
MEVRLKIIAELPGWSLIITRCAGVHVIGGNERT